MKRLFILFGLIVCLNIGLQAQDFHMPKPSPTITVHQGFSTSFIKLKYSRPSVKGRTVFGDLIPYGTLWRTGANEATKITFGEDVNIAEHPIEAGSYALYTIPGKKEWTIIINKGVKNWGPSGYDKDQDVARFKVPVKKLKNTQETLLISIENMTNNSCDWVISWAETKIVIPVKTDNKQRILSHLEKALQGEKPPYSTAAGYYLSTNYKLDKALEYADKAIEQNPKAFHLYWLRARINDELGNHKKAVADAKTAAEKAKGTAFEVEYERHYQDMLKKDKRK